MVGQTVEVENKKDGDFWQWVSISASGATSNVAQTSTGVTATRVSGSNYETKEERAARQGLIVRQSSLSNAIATLSVGAKTPPEKEKVLDLAQEYTDWVFNNPSRAGGVEDMSDDIPF